MFYRILNQVGTFLSPRTSPFGLRSALWLDLLSGGNPGEGSFFVFSPDPENGHPSTFGGGDGGGSFLPVIRLQGFSWYDFASFDNSSSAKLGHGGKSIRQKKEHVFATSRCSSWRRPER